MATDTREAVPPPWEPLDLELLSIRGVVSVRV